MQTVKSNLTSRSYRYDLPVFSLSRLLCCSQLIGWKHQTVHASFNALLSTESLCSDSNWGLNRLNRQCQLKMRKNKSLIDKNTNKVWRCLKQGHPFFILIHLGSLHWKGNTVSADSCHPPWLYHCTSWLIKRWENNIQPDAKGYCIWNYP